MSLSGKATTLILNYGMACAGKGTYIEETGTALKEYIAALELVVDRSRSTPKTNPDDA